MTPVMLAILSGAVAFGVLVVVLVSRWAGSEASERLAEATGGMGRPVAQIQQQAVAPSRDPLPFISQALEGTQLLNTLQLELLRSGLMLRPSEALAICMTAGLVGLGAGWLITGQPITGLLLGAVGVFGPYMYMKQRAARRQANLTSQLPDALDMLGSALRSGYALTRGFQVISSQMHPPISEEFRRVLQEVQVGISVSEALGNMLMRTASYDLELVVAAVQTQLTMGGNLSEVLDNISSMIRERVRLQGEINAATSEGRLSAAILVAMPFGMMLLLSIVNPNYLQPLFHERAGIMMLIGVGLLMVSGLVIIRKLLDIAI